MVTWLHVRDYYLERKRLLDEKIKEFLEEEGLADVTPTPFGGKRLRGVMTLLVAEALGARTEDALPAAVAIELAHAASLDVDDIIDLDVFRRGRIATWVTKGIIRAALGTHALVAAAYKLIENYGFDAVKVFNETYMAMIRGEAMDVSTSGIYESIIAAKTASLWAAAAAMGAIAARKRDVVRTARDYGFATGMAFQIADDIVDVVKAVENLEVHRIAKSPSAIAFITYIGAKTLLEANPLMILWHGVKMIEAEVRTRAMRKLDEWLNEATRRAKMLPVVSDEYRELLAQYPHLAVEMMLQELVGEGRREDAGSAGL